MLTRTTVRQTAIETTWVSGPRRLDVEGWRKILVSRNYGKTTVRLQKIMAKYIKIVIHYTKKCKPRYVSAIMASLLIW